MIKTIFIILLSFISIGSCLSQKESPTFNKIGAINLSFGYGVEFPFADMADRYSTNLKFTLGIEKVTKSQWIYGLEFAFMFGDTVKEDVLHSLRIPNGEVLGADNAYADVFTRERGLFLGINFGKIIKFNKNSRSGLRLTNAIGIFQHYVRIGDEHRSLPQLDGDYKKGYDRLSRGLALRQFVGYHHISDNKRINFIIGLEFTEGFTKHVRAIDFDTGLMTSQKTRFDGLVSLKAAYILPFYDDYVAEEIFY
ncbi:MAG: hypothetical protein V3V14_04805 [Saprospiraceae bacterium]